MLEISVFHFRPQWASNGVIFVVEFGINLMFSIMFATRFARFTDDQSGSTSSTASRLFLFVWTFLPCLSLYGHQLVLGLVLCFCFCKIIQILLLWKFVPDRILLSVVFRGVYSNSLDILLLCLCHKYWMFPHVGIVIIYQQLPICSCFVFCFWMGLVLRNPFGFPRLVLSIHLISSCNYWF